MKNIVYLIAILIFASCNDKKPEGSNSYTTTPNGMQDIQKSASSTSSDGKELILNPAHGEPGHRCDLAVGAPLNANTAASQAAPAPAETAPQEAAEPSKEADNKVMLNPAHGMPGHRCDLEVGAPLK
ncbi:MAG: hypothetical protein EOO90_02255 [Pedobacter sp.]|nr:MAG: hypothetical protein EOO90_02255 [Pedobacter sp.]